MAREGKDARRRMAQSREVYGFVLYLCSILAACVFMAWSLVPDELLHSVGITYYPSKRWTIILPIWTLGLIPFLLFSFMAMNLINTYPLDSFYTFTDDISKIPTRQDLVQDVTSNQHRSPPLQEMPLWLTNAVLYES